MAQVNKANTELDKFSLEQPNVRDESLAEK
ncbi:hypothetical protein VRRI112168_02405 [Vreelandella rituensis]